jgi:hypothetical protein
VIVFMRPREAPHIDKLLALFPIHAVLTHPVSEAAMQAALQADASLGATFVATLHVCASEQNLTCRDDGAALAVGGVWAREGMFGASKVRLALHKDRQGNLLVRQQEHGVGFYGVLPIPGGCTNWYRFRPAPASTP